jgi:beta-glucanase (GH16 family)
MSNPLKQKENIMFDLGRKKNKLFIVVFVILNPSLCFSKDPLLPGAWEEIVELTDEFEGEVLNTNKWRDKDDKWVGRHPSYFEASNISVENGELHLASREINNQDIPPVEEKKGDFTHAAAAVKSKVKVKYGYFEIRAKAGNSKFWNSFWFYDYTPKNWTEIDVFEIVRSENYLLRTAHHFKSPTYKVPEEKHMKVQQEVFDYNSTDYHIYGLDWNKDSITWYVDGEKVFTTPNYHWHQDLYMMFDTEINAKWPGIPESNNLPSNFKIDYIRSWKMKDECQSTTTFKDKQWSLITLPCDPAGRTLEELFSQELGGNYSEDWVVYGFDSLLGEFKKVDLNDQLKAGKGYWFIQISGNDIEYTMTGSALSKYQRIDVVSKEAALTWNMIGNPYPHAIESKDTQWYSEESGSRMNWSEADSQNLVHASVFLYENGGYTKKDMSNPETKIDPWHGYWVPILDDYHVNPVYLSGAGIDWKKFITE